MPTFQKNVALPEEVLSAIQEVARAEGKTADQWVEELALHRLRTMANDREWNDLLDYGAKLGRRYSEADVDSAIRELR